METKAGQRLFSRTILRSYARQLDSRARLDDIISAASPELSSFLRDLDAAPAWISAAVFGELLQEVERRHGRSAVRELGIDLMKSSGLAQVLTPIIRFSLEFEGNTPAALFANIEGMASVVSRGLTFRWIPGHGPTGTISLRCEEPIAEVCWAPWEGAFSYAFDLTGTSGTVARARPDDDGCGCEIAVAWNAEASGRSGHTV